MPAVERNPASFSVKAREWWTVLVADEKGVLNAMVVKRNRPRPKYQSLFSVQTPFRLEYVDRMYVLAKETRILVAKNVGRIISRSCMLVILTYEKANVDSMIDIVYTMISALVGRYGEPVFSSIFSFRFDEMKSSSHFFRVSGISSLSLSIIFPINPLAAPVDTVVAAVIMAEVMPTAMMAKIDASAPLVGVGIQAVFATSLFGGFVVAEFVFVDHTCA